MAPQHPTNPVLPGAFNTLFGTGAGRLKGGLDPQSKIVPSEPWLLPLPILPVKVTIGGEEAEVCPQVGSILSRGGVTICVG